MTVLSISEKRKSLYKDISCSLEELLSKTDNYINTFDKTDFFAFSNGSQKNKIYQKNYYSFSISIADTLVVLDRLMGDISSLLICADKEMNVDELVVLQNLFGEYLKFKEASSMYFSKTEKSFLSDSISLSELLDGAKKFRFNIIFLVEITK